MEDFNQRETKPAEQCAPYLHSIPIFVTCTFLENSFKGNRVCKGFIKDISPRELSLEGKDNYFTVQKSLLLTAQWN